MTSRTATCACGQLRVTCVGEPVRVSICHCLACRQRTGSAFGTQARFGRDQVTVEGEATVFARVGDSGGTAHFRFCPRCGSTVYWAFDGAPDVLAVSVGCFADPAFPPPTVSVYEDRQSPWLAVAPDTLTERWA